MHSHKANRVPKSLSRYPSDINRLATSNRGLAFKDERKRPKSNALPVRREREIGIRIAVGACIGSITRLVTTQIFVTVFIGAAAGKTLGMASVRYVQTLLFGLKGTDPSMLIAPALVLLGPALLAALPAVLRAARIDPSIMLRTESAFHILCTVRH